MNRTRKIILCKGIQELGKSTWTKEWLMEDPNNRVRFSNDEIQMMMTENWTSSKNVILEEIKKSFIRKALLLGYDIVIETSDLTQREICYYKNMVLLHNDLVDEMRADKVLEDADDFYYEIEIKEINNNN